MMENIESDIDVGMDIFCNVPNTFKPYWAGIILSSFNSKVKNNPVSITELLSIIEQPDRWGEAHDQFTKIRRFLLDNKSYEPESYILLAESVAKITYNASNLPAPFDYDSGWHIPSLALKTSHYFNDERLEDEIRKTILLFTQNKKFKDNIIAAKDFLLYKKIDDILWYDWDPIGINDSFPRDEYQAYIPAVFNLRKANASSVELAEYLLKVETEHMSMRGTIENCLKVADKITELKL